MGELFYTFKIGQETRHVKSSCQYKDIKFLLFAIHCSDGASFDFLDGCCLHSDIILTKRFEIIFRGCDTFTTHEVFWNKLLHEIRSSLSFDTLTHGFCNWIGIPSSKEALVISKDDIAKFTLWHDDAEYQYPNPLIVIFTYHPINVPAMKQKDQRHPSKQELFELGIMVLLTHTHPSRRTLVANQVGCLFLKSWNSLNSAGTTSHHCHTLVGEINRAIPIRCVHNGSLESSKFFGCSGYANGADT